MQINTSWTLFLDRDGVINNEIKDGYVLNWDMFCFADGVLEAMPVFAEKFGHIVIVTNQRCIGRGLLTEDGLNAIHDQMLLEIRAKGGRIDRIYHCPDVNNDSPCRKPQNGMALQAQTDFPDIDFSRSVIVGNTLSDMNFGKNLGMKSVFIPSTQPHHPYPHPLMDARCNSLLDFSRIIQ